MAAAVRDEVLERLRFLHEIGIDGLALPRMERQVAAATSASTGGAAAELKRVREEMGECSRCQLCQSRSRIVFGAGDPDARLMFIGEAPGQEEDRKGEPFVGRAGQLLDRMILSMGLRREEVYIANVVKCRPPENRNPQRDEVEACRSFLAAQIHAIRPAVIVALGKFAASALLQEEVAITRARGQLRSYGSIPLMPTYHPAYLLRQYTQENRRAVYSDLMQVKDLLEKAAAR